ncbi:tripartite motif-containing protein 16 [Mixophyes fleayi]|uniref:tripartite motif-containing protein 16 n=1 Tax=Mixophyes fleayi TaxID=3061075 RepID=UPI003F4E3F5D
MADSNISTKSFSKCQSCIEISSMTLAEDQVVTKTCKSHSIGELSLVGVTANGSAAGDSEKVHLLIDKTPIEDTETDKVLCDFCLEEKVKAVKTCLTCMVNYCSMHLRPHLDNPKLHSHQLVHPGNDLDLRTCSTHNKPLDWFCNVDLMCVCEECIEESHKDHHPISCTEARKQLEADVQEIVTEYDWKLKCAEHAIVKLEANTASIENSIAETRRATDLQFEQLQDAVRKAQSNVQEFLEQRERTALNQSIGIKTHLEQKCNELKKIKARVERIAKYKSEFCFFQEYCDFKKATSDDNTLPSVYIGLIDKLSGIGTVVTDSTEKVIQLLQTSYTDKLQEFAKEENVGIKTMVSAIVPAKHKISAPEPSTRDDFLKYKSNVTLDPVTAHCFLRLLQSNRKVTNSSPWQQSYPDHPERFQQWRQVLSAESFYMGRHYFEVEFKGEVIHVGVTYKCIDRKGSESNSNITGNDFSWTLKWNGKEFSAWHSDVEIPLKAEKFSRIGVYIDYQRGTVAFYGVKDTMTLLHRFEGTFFSEPLYAAFWLPKKENSVTIIGPDDMSHPVTILSPVDTKVLSTSSVETVTSSTKTELVVNTTIQTIKVEMSSVQETTSPTESNLPSGVESINKSTMIESDHTATKVTTV